MHSCVIIDHANSFHHILYPIYDVLEIMWLEIRKSYSKHGHPSTRCLWGLKSKDHINNRDMNQLDLWLGIIPLSDS